jgi:hypothetical protein
MNRTKKFGLVWNVLSLFSTKASNQDLRSTAKSHGNSYQYMVGLPNCAWYDTARTAWLLKRVKPMLNTL